MAEVVIRAEGLGKKYLIGHAAEREGYVALRDVLARGGRSLWRKTADMVRGRALVGGDAVEEFWALKDVSFEVRRGEVLGIIGRNGAGKSTLLKILSRITEPTEGRVSINGRVASLLEVGTGFHPELTGRENIYLNGAILGMTRAEIRKKFDEIVAFAEIDKFLDTPVKRYSSGMYVRLAFAVAAHLEPEILIVDEVLAVGDAEFQKKCLGKMDEVARGQGRTVVFVSHNLGAVKTLCDRATLIKNGTTVYEGSASSVVTAYLQSLYASSATSVAERSDRKGCGKIRLVELRICGRRGSEPITLETGGPARFVLKLSDVQSGVACSFTIYDQLGQPVTYFDSPEQRTGNQHRSASAFEFTCDIDELLLFPGRYSMNVGVTWNTELQDHLEGAAFLNIEEGTVRGCPVHFEAKYGSVFIPHRWSVQVSP